MRFWLFSSSKAATGRGQRTCVSGKAITSMVRYSLRASGRVWSLWPLAAACHPRLWQVLITAWVRYRVQAAMSSSRAAFSRGEANSCCLTVSKNALLRSMLFIAPCSSSGPARPPPSDAPPIPQDIASSKLEPGSRSPGPALSPAGSS